MDKEWARIDVSLNWHEIDHIIVMTRILIQQNTIEKDYGDKLIEHLEPFSMKAKTET